MQESILHYDVAGHPKCAFQFSVAFPFHPATRTAPPQVRGPGAAANGHAPPTAMPPSSN